MDPPHLTSHLQIDKRKGTLKMQVLFPWVHLQLLIQLDERNTPRCVTMCMCKLDLQFGGFCIMKMFSNLITKSIDFIVTNKYLKLEMGWIITYFNVL